MQSVSGNQHVSSQIAGVFAEFNSCPQHRGMPITRGRRLGLGGGQSVSGNQHVSSQIAGVFAEFNSCPQHRGTVQ